MTRPGICLFQGLLRRNDPRLDCLHTLVGQSLRHGNPLPLRLGPGLVSSADVLLGQGHPGFSPDSVHLLLLGGLKLARFLGGSLANAWGSGGAQQGSIFPVSFRSVGGISEIWYLEQNFAGFLFGLFLYKKSVINHTSFCQRG